MKLPHLPLIVSTLLLLPWIATAQQAAPTTPTPSNELPGTLPPGVSIEPAAATPQLPAAAPVRAQAEELPTPKGTIRVNFQNASLNDVLNYLSEAAGFVIVTDTQVSGTVNVVSRQPVTPEEAVDLLNTVLVSKGFVAIRSGRILKIVNRSVAAKSAIPVIVGSDPMKIPQKDEMVTQILPVRFVEAAKLVENLRPLLSENSQITANESSNAILMTDTQVNIRRIAEIISALDTSISGASSMRIFQLKFADATQLANVITQLFSSTQTGGAQAGQQGGGGRGGFGGFGGPGGGFGGPGGFGGRGGGGGGGGAAASANVRQQAAKVVAVADTQSNSVIVNAPDDVMPTIEDIITRTDTNITDTAELKLFHLKHADATEMASILTSLYGTASGATQGGQGNQGGGRGQGQGFGNQGGFGRQGGFNQPQANAAATSPRAMLQAQVTAVPDARTNTVLVSASRDTMLQIAETIGRLDASKEKKQRVFVHKLQNADADNVAAILQGMLGNQAGSTSSQPSTSRLNQRTTTGASSEITDAINTSSGRAGGTGR